MKSPKTHSDNKQSHNHPTTSVSQSRIPIFAPVSRIAQQKAGNKNEDTTFKTSWGSCTIKDCRLTQTHRDIVDSILTHHEKIFKFPTGEIAYGINSYQILKKMGYKNPGDVQWLKDKLEDMRMTSMIVHDLGLIIHTGVILQYAYGSNRTLITGANGKTLPGKGDLLYVQFSTQFIKIFGMEMNVHYPSHVDSICQIESPLVKAVVRFFLTHDGKTYEESKYRPETLLNILGIICLSEPDKKHLNNISERRFRDKIKELLDSAPLLEKYGILFHNNNFYYPEKLDGVWFTPSNYLNGVQEEEKSDENGQVQDGTDA